MIRPAILWNDQRTAAECAEIEERIGLERLIQLTGNRALTGFTAPKLLWLRTHEPEAFARIAHVLLPKDYVRFRRTGEHAIDVADASGTLLFDVANRRWSDEVLAALELPREWLPPAYESTEIAGAGDQAAGALGVGIDAPGPLSVVLGTSGVVFAALDAYRPEPEARLHTFCHAVPGTWHAMGVMLSAAGSLQWLRTRARQALRTTSCLRRRRPGRRAPRACSSSPTSRASGRRTPTRMRAARSSACSFATTAAHSSGRCSKASPTGCATRSSCCAASASRPRSAGSRAAARAASSGSGSSPPSSASHSSGPRPRRAPPTARRCSARSRRASSPTHTRPSRRPCASATASSRTPAGRRRTRTATPATGALYPALEPLI